MKKQVISYTLAICFIWAPLAHADSQSDWLKARRAEYVAWSAAHPNVEAQLADLKRKTEGLVAAYRSRPRPPGQDVDLPPATFRVPGAPTALWDGPDTPQMVVIPAGAYTMGTLGSLPGSDEVPHRVTIGNALAVGKYDVTRAEYAAFVSSTGYTARANDGCYVFNGKWQKSSAASWERPGFNQTANDPVVCVGWDDANAYAAWLSKKTGHAYRLLSESEWEYAARAGTRTFYWWGDDIGTNMANCEGCGSKWDNKQTSPSGSFRANPFGLYDMAGNVWQWTTDCNAALAVGSTSASGSCGGRVGRGGSWNDNPLNARAANRGGGGNRNAKYGFRVARIL